MDQLRFRRQYIIASKPQQAPDGWKIMQWRDCWLASHPDLETASVEFEEGSLTLLGYLLDPDHPSRTNQQILEYLTSGTCSTGDLIPRTAILGGRWALMLHWKGKRTILTDPCGFRQIYYTRTGSDDFLIASQPELMKTVTTLTPDEDEDMQAFLQAPAYTREHQFFGNRTRYKNVFHLMPNHYLDIDNGKSIRFFPGELLQERTSSNASEKAARILEGQIEAASRRYRLALPVTSGWDSRVVLAAGWNHLDTMLPYVMKSPKLKVNHPDLTVPPKLLDNHASRFHVMSYPGSVPEHFLQSGNQMSQEPDPSAPWRLPCISATF